MIKRICSGMVVAGMLFTFSAQPAAANDHYDASEQIDLLSQLVTLAEQYPAFRAQILPVVTNSLQELSSKLESGDMMMEDEMGMNESPEISDLFAGASAVFYSEDSEMLFVSSNTEGEVAAYTVDDMDMMSYDVEAMDADGIYYNDDMLYQVNRSDNRIDMYQWDDDEFMLEGSSMEDDFMNGRELAVMGDWYIVAQDAGDSNNNQNALVVYQMDDDELEFVTQLNVDINLWGIKAAGDDLHAIVDNSNEVAVFTDFFDMDMDMNEELEADMMIEIAGLTRTHGLDANLDEDVVVFTDIGAADMDDDGALVIVHNFMDAAADGMIDMDEQIRIEGDNTMLGNPVDVAIDYENMMIYVAERANMGGQVLGFKLPK